MQTPSVLCYTPVRPFEPGCLQSLEHLYAKMISIPALRYEVGANPDPVRRRHVQLVLQELGIPVTFSLFEVRKRASELNAKGVKPADATHLALAEQAGCDFVTVDDRFLSQLRRTETAVWFGTPIAYCEKEDLR